MKVEAEFKESHEDFNEEQVGKVELYKVAPLLEEGIIEIDIGDVLYEYNKKIGKIYNDQKISNGLINIDENLHENVSEILNVCGSQLKEIRQNGYINRYEKLEEKWDSLKEARSKRIFSAVKNDADVVDKLTLREKKFFRNLKMSYDDFKEGR